MTDGTMAASATTQSTDSAAHAGPPKPATNTPLHNRETGPELKRKATDQNLEIITIDPYYDLTLIVGSPNHEHGQMALRVNRGCMRNVSDIWTKMLTGDWAELKQSEIEMPDDSWKALLIVLRMAHSQFAQLPEQLSSQDLCCLAVLTDKYNLGTVVRIMLELKKWLFPYKAVWIKWPSHPDMQMFAQMTLAFGLDADHKYLVNRLAVEVQVHEETMRFSLASGDKQIPLRSTLPDRILTQIDDIRTAILSVWISSCDAAVRMALEGTTDPTNESNPTCSKDLCAVTRCGILMKGLHTAGFKLDLKKLSPMYQSVASYWKKLKSIGDEFKPYSPCDKTYGYGRGAHVSTCDFEDCFGDFGLINEVKATLKACVHEDVFDLLQKDEYLEACT